MSRLYPVIAPAHGLEKALDAVGQMQEQSHHCTGIDKCNKDVLECRDHHAENIGNHVGMQGYQVCECGCFRADHLEGEMQQMIHDESKQEQTGPDHVFAGKGSLLGRT